MFESTLRGQIGQDLRRHSSPEDAAWAVASTLNHFSDGQVRPRKGWIQAHLAPIIDSAKDRAEGCMDWAALAVSRDLAWTNAMGIIELGLFAHDPPVMRWREAELARRSAMGH